MMCFEALLRDAVLMSMVYRKAIGFTVIDGSTVNTIDVGLVTDCVRCHGLVHHR